jgi:AbrB family looped-hinge helix DNA binding protein
MELVVDGYGRVGFPKALRQEFNLGPGSRLRVVERDHEIVLTPEKEPAPCRKKGSTLVFTGEAIGSIANSVSRMRQERDNHLGGL